MLQEMVIGFLSALRVITSCLPGGMILLPPGFLAGLPVQLTLWATGAPFFAISVCPSRNARACGSNAQVGWSSVSFGLAGLAIAGLIGGLLPLSSVIHTNTQWTPLLEGSTTNSSFRIGPLARHACWSLFTFSRFRC